LTKGKPKRLLMKNKRKGKNRRYASHAIRKLPFTCTRFDYTSVVLSSYKVINVCNLSSSKPIASPFLSFPTQTLTKLDNLSTIHFLLPHCTEKSLWLRHDGPRRRNGLFAVTVCPKYQVGLLQSLHRAKKWGGKLLRFMWRRKSPWVTAHGGQLQVGWFSFSSFISSGLLSSPTSSRKPTCDSYDKDIAVL
jgi:hypothetical protein